MMEPRIIYKPAFTVVGLSQNLGGGEQDLETLWEQLGARYREIPFADPDVGYGVHIITKQAHHYLAGLGVMQHQATLPADMVEYRVEPHTYAVFTHNGPMATLPEMVDRVFDSWLPEGDYRPCSDFYFEFYDDHFQPNSSQSTLFIWVPVIPKRSVDI